MMPEMDGYEATQRIRSSQDRSISSLIIVALTANASTKDRDKCLSSGMDDFLSKPVVFADLDATISKWMEEKCKLASKSI
jgi:CheY-like chemotaxis protein